MPGVAHDGAVLHRLKMAANNDVFHARGRAENVADLGGLVHRHHAVAFHDGPKSRKRVDFGDDDVGAHAASTHGDTAAAVAKARNDERLAGEEHAGRSKNPVERGLARAVDVVEIPLGHGVVDGDNGVAQVACSGHGTKPMNAGGGFLGSADNAGGVFGFFTVDTNDEVGAVVEGQGRFELEGFVDAPVEILRGLAVPSVDGVALAGEPSSDLVLRGEGVAARPRNLGACCTNRLDKNGRFFGHVEAPGHTHTGQRFGALGLVLKFGQHRHAGSRPIDEKGPAVGQFHVANGVVLALVQIIHASANCPPLLKSIVSP